MAVLAAERLEERGIGRIDLVADDVADPFAVGVGRALHARGMIAWSIGMASIRSIWAMVRSVTIDGAVSPLPSASRRMSALAAMNAG